MSHFIYWFIFAVAAIPGALTLLLVADSFCEQYLNDLNEEDEE